MVRLSHCSSIYTITKIKINKNVVITLNPPVGNSKRFVSKTIHPDKNYIPDILFIPSIVSKELLDSLYLDDDHFCSLLCDRGYFVHILCNDDVFPRDSSDKPIQCLCDPKQLEKIISTLNLSPRSTAIISQELSSIALLRLLPQVSIPVLNKFRCVNSFTFEWI
jgi:hypothetical protein